MRGRTRIYVEHPSGVRVCIHEGPTTERPLERIERERQERESAADAFLREWYGITDLPPYPYAIIEPYQRNGVAYRDWRVFHANSISRVTR